MRPQRQASKTLSPHTKYMPPINTFTKNDFASNGSATVGSGQEQNNFNIDSAYATLG